MEPNPYQSPQADPGAETPHVPVFTCPECGQPMEPGYVSTGQFVFWRRWTTPWWLPYAGALRGTGPRLFGFQKLSGYRCQRCEVVVFRYGNHKLAYAPDQYVRR